MRKLITALALSTVTLSSYATCAVLNFTYTVPTAREDGKALAITDLSSCRLYDITSGTAQKIADLPMNGKYSYSTTVTGTRKYVADCVDKSGVASKYSTVASVTIPTTPPTTTPTSKPVRSVFQVEVNYKATAP
jgi:hypothetical protein